MRSTHRRTGRITALIIFGAVAAALLPAHSFAAVAEGDIDAAFNSGNPIVDQYLGGVGPEADYHTVSIGSGDSVSFAGGSSFVIGGAYVSRFTSGGVFDVTFDGDGRISSHYVGDGTINDWKESAIDSEGRLVVAGWANDSGSSENIGVARYMPNGALDTSFDTDGWTAFKVDATDSLANTMLVESDDRIVVAGYVEGGSFAVARLLESGAFDTTFGGGDGSVAIPIPGAADASAYGIARTTDGGYVLAGRAWIGAGDSAIVKITSTGALDPSFDDDGIATFNLGSADGFDDVLQLPGGDIIAVGSADSSEAKIVRVDSAGDLVGTFGTAGVVTVDGGLNDRTFQAVALDHDGKLLVAGQDDVLGVLERRSAATGALDTSFSGDGIVTRGQGNYTAFDDIAIDSHRRIVVGGYGYDGSDHFGYATRYIGDTAPFAVTAPSITGSGAVGEDLTCNTGDWSGAPTFSYQWMRDGSDIGSATNAMYTVQAADIGTALTCEVTGDNGETDTATTDAFDVPPLPSNDVLPAITGTAAVGSMLTCSNGTWSDAVSFTRQWRRDGTSISGATDPTYTVAAADAGSTISCHVTAANGSGSAGATSTGVDIAPVPAMTTAPRITGTPIIGSSIRCLAGAWTGSPTITFRWVRDGEVTSNTTSTYTVRTADAGATLNCRVRAANSSGAVVQPTSGVRADLCGNFAGMQFRRPLNTVLASGLCNGNAAANSITGTMGVDRIFGNAGGDVISGRGGNDVLSGGAGPDTLIGGAGTDTLFGGPANDVVNTVDGAGGDTANCGPGGRDAVRADPGDVLIGCELKTVV